MNSKLNRRDFMKTSLVAVALGRNAMAMGHKVPLNSPKHPNIILIYADDLGYGDLSCYGATGVKTPNVDRLAKEGIKFMQGYATSSTCTPSRYSLLTGQYAWRKKNTGIASSNAPLLIDTKKVTLPSMLKGAGYTTGVVGKWHLGLGNEENGPDWNNEINPGPLEIGFHYSFILPVTGDRVPCVFVENHRVVGLDPNDPIAVTSYKNPLPGPNGMTHRDQLKMDWSHGHNNTIVNGISRLGYMTGGKAAQWKDEEIPDTLIEKATVFIKENKENPFFLYFSTHDIHVPRVPHPRFVGKTDMGPRGDAIVQFDFQVGEILNTLDRLGLTENTLVILTSDNGPVLDDGYKDQAAERLGDHKPGGPLRGGKYSIFDAGTREPFIVRWPRKINPDISNAYISQVDMIATLAALTGQKLRAEEAPDSFNMLETLLGKDKIGREYIVEHSRSGALAICMGDWKYIEPHQGKKINGGNETGNDPNPQLYNLKDDIAETINLAEEYPKRVKEMADKLQAIKNEQ